jgi:hypothetical protein
MNIKKLTQEMVDSINVKPLKEEIEKVINTKITFKKSFEKGKFYVTSQNIANKAGVLSNIFEYLVVQTFSSEYYFYEDFNEKKIWMSISFNWQYKSGGSNGTHLLNVWYSFNTKEWTFRK